ncbi:hypothetical protein AB8O64_21665 [Streptomyces sp. QH1-20]|uniref:hypothetical protein n=1 Tax=Streptomyces sp. QH1-20 TaxID=3240934 RepID=UPI0035143AB1
MGVDTEKIEIVRADETHLADVVALAESRRLDASNPVAAGRDGFLVSDYTLDDYRGRLISAEHFWGRDQGQRGARFPPRVQR